MLYLFPARNQMADFRDARLMGLIEANPALKQYLGGVSNKGLMRFAASHLYLRGAESIRDVVSIDADLLIFDEYDLINLENLLEAERRIAASQNPMIRRVGIPTELGWGIWARYTDSDQRRWHVTCPGCGEEQPLTFEDSVRWRNDYGRIVDEHLACRACAQVIDPANGRWIAAHPERSIPGFQVSRLMVPGVDLKTLITASKRQDSRARQKFSANDLAEPYAEPLSGLTPADIAKAVALGTAWNDGDPLRQEKTSPGLNLVTAGVDPAGTRLFRVRISELVTDPGQGAVVRRGLFIGTVSNWDELPALCSRYGVHLVCVDAAPELNKALEFADRYSRIVFLVRELWMPGDPMKIDEDNQQVKVDRTFMLDTTFESLRLGGNLLPEDLPAGYVDEMTSPKRTFEEVRGRRQARYLKRGDDDYAHAEGFDYIAACLLTILNAREEEVLLTPIEDVLPGYKPSSWPSYDSLDLNDDPPEYHPGQGPDIW